MRVAVTQLRARRVPQRLTAVMAVGLGGAAVAQLPAPSLHVGIEAAGYPAVLVGALVPVLVGTVAVAPVSTSLTWLVGCRDGRSRSWCCSS